MNKNNKSCWYRLTSYLCKFVYAQPPHGIGWRVCVCVAILQCVCATSSPKVENNQRFFLTLRKTEHHFTKSHIFQHTCKNAGILIPSNANWVVRIDRQETYCGEYLNEINGNKVQGVAYGMLFPI
jgi:hypothetical protein